VLVKIIGEQDKEATTPIHMWNARFSLFGIADEELAGGLRQ